MDVMPNIEREYWKFTVIFLIVIISLIFEGIDSIPIIGFVLLILIYQNRKRSSFISKSEQSRYNEIKWLVDQITETQDESRTNLEYSLLQELDQNPKNEFFVRELSILSENRTHELNHPQIIRSEKESAKLEERASILIGLTVFLPVLFGLLHLFRFVTWPIMLLEIIIFTLIAEIVIDTQDPIVNLTGWTDEIGNLKSSLLRIESKGRQEMIHYKQGIDNPFHFELGQPVKIISKRESSMGAALIIHMMSQIDPLSRLQILPRLIESITPLGKQEQIISSRWSVYKSRVLLISSIGIVIAALFGVLSSLIIPDLGSNFVSIESTPHLFWGLFLVTIVINLKVIKSWTTPNEIIKWGAIWTVTYIASFIINLAMLSF